MTHLHTRHRDRSTDAPHARIAAAAAPYVRTPAEPTAPVGVARAIRRRLADLLGPLSLHRFGHGHEGDAADAGDAEDDVLARYRRRAGEVHDRVVHDHDVTCVEFLGATGGGKTTLLERLIERAPPGETVGVIVGDVAGDDDARRLEARGADVVTVNTGKECHLDAALVADALEAFDLAELDRLYLENVGNMVCPADFPLGAQTRVLVVSTTEGDDVVAKHPLLFQACDATVVNKVDLAEAVGADVERMRADVAEVAPGMDVFETNARDDVGVDALAEFLGNRTHDEDYDHGHGHVDDHGHGHQHSHDGDHGHDEDRADGHDHERAHE